MLLIIDMTPLPVAVAVLGGFVAVAVAVPVAAGFCGCAPLRLVLGFFVAVPVAVPWCQCQWPQLVPFGSGRAGLSLSFWGRRLRGSPLALGLGGFCGTPLSL